MVKPRSLGNALSRGCPSMVPEQVCLPEEPIVNLGRFNVSPTAAGWDRDLPRNFAPNRSARISRVRFQPVVYYGAVQISSFFLQKYFTQKNKYPPPNDLLCCTAFCAPKIPLCRTGLAYFRAAYSTRSWISATAGQAAPRQ